MPCSASAAGCEPGKKPASVTSSAGRARSRSSGMLHGVEFPAPGHASTVALDPRALIPRPHPPPRRDRVRDDVLGRAFAPEPDQALRRAGAMLHQRRLRCARSSCCCASAICCARVSRRRADRPLRRGDRARRPAGARMARCAGSSRSIGPGATLADQAQPSANMPRPRSASTWPGRSVSSSPITPGSAGASITGRAHWRTRTLGCAS